jgi:enoyl-CoA hydratase/carnithine racemase
MALTLRTDDAMTDNILVERDESIVTVTLNRPEKLNALSYGMYDRLGQAFEEIAADDGVRCVVLRGAGERAFCAGADIGEFDSDRAGARQARDYAQYTLRASDRVNDCPHPVIAAIRGICVGGGLELAARCDLRVCGEGSRFGIPINRLGLTVDYDELRLLVDVAGYQAMLEVLLEGRLFDAADALRMGLVGRVVPDDAVEATVFEMARRIAAAAPLVNRWHKKFLRRLLDPRPLSDEERDEAFACFETEDYRIGCAAFLEKGTPEFKGR